MLSDADSAELYDLLNPWDPERSPGDRFYHQLVMAADAVLDVGCGTGAMLACAREHGHRGRLAGRDPDRAALDRARRRATAEWTEGTAADAPWRGEFDLVVMTGHAFQFLVTDDELRASLAGIRAALRPGGRFAFETRHPQARAWEEWNPARAADFTGPGGRALRLWHEVESVDGSLVTFTGTTATRTGAEPGTPGRPGEVILSTSRTTLRFLDPAAVDAFLGAAGFQVEARYGDWDRTPVTASSREIITVARRD